MSFFEMTLFLITVSLVHSDSTHASESQSFQHISCIRINLDDLLLQSRDFGNKVQSAFTFFFLKLQGDTTDRSLCNSTHQVSCVSSNLVAHALRWKDGYLIHDSLVGVEIKSESSVVFLDNSASTLLYGLCTNTL